MGGFFGVASKRDCVLELFYGVDYHSHLGTRRGGMATHGEEGFNRAIHNIENSPFRTKFDHDVAEMKGNLGIGCISDFEPQPLLSAAGSRLIDRRPVTLRRAGLRSAAGSLVPGSLLHSFFHRRLCLLRMDMRQRLTIAAALIDPVILIILLIIQSAFFTNAVTV